MNVYFDNAAQVPPFDWALKEFCRLALACPGNQEASGRAGFLMSKLMEKSSEKLVKALHAKGFQVMWHNTGTDSIAAALESHCRTYSAPVIALTRAEHPALLEAAKRTGAKLRFIQIDRTGKILPKSLQSVLAQRVTLIAVHHVNAETGAIQDPVSIRRFIDESPSRNAEFLLDTTQSACKLEIPFHAANLSYATVSGCKIGAPCGAALLYADSAARNGCPEKLRSLEHRFGRCVPAAAGTIAFVAEKICGDLSVRAGHAAALKKQILDAFQWPLTAPDSSPYILHTVFEKYQGAILVRMLSPEGISAAAGSACLAETPKPSAVLTAMGYPDKTAFGAFRLSFWDSNTGPEAEYFINILKSALKNY